MDQGDFYEVAAITLHYYDKAYLHGMAQREEALIHPLVITTLNTNLQIEAILTHPLINFTF